MSPESWLVRSVGWWSDSWGNRTEEASGDGVAQRLVDECCRVQQAQEWNARNSKDAFEGPCGAWLNEGLFKTLYGAEHNKKRWQEYTEELYKKHLHDPHNHDGVITHLEPDILECEVKWAVGSITFNKASGGDGIPVQLFQILKDDAVKVLHSICQQIWKTQQWPQDWKRSVFIPIPKKGNAKECSNYRTIALISQASKVILKILQARFQ